ncbi:MAG: translation initiation factor [Paludibacteraceae bacterium]|nr:translation initiation factor [Paludibacteraceae bacterium]
MQTPSNNWQDALSSLRNSFSDSDLVQPEETVQEQPTVVKQHLCLSFQRRSGKPATIVTGFEGTEQELLDFAKELKVKFSVGGSVRDGEMLLQGDIRKPLREYL